MLIESIFCFTCHMDQFMPCAFVLILISRLYGMKKQCVLLFRLERLFRWFVYTVIMWRYLDSLMLKHLFLPGIYDPWWWCIFFFLIFSLIWLINILYRFFCLCSYVRSVYSLSFFLPCFGSRVIFTLSQNLINAHILIL